MPTNLILDDPVLHTAAESFGLKFLYPYQRLVIANILETAGFYSSETTNKETDYRSRQIVILPTGAGKSLCFMLPSLLLSGPTLIIFPLLSLISDQKRRCDDAGISSAALTGGQSRNERDEIFRNIENGSLRIILTNPETALSPPVFKRLLRAGISHLVFDEVHTVSEWGDSFRPVYLECRRLIAEMNIPVVTAFTATASETVLSRIIEILFPGESPHIISANPDRPNISYSVVPCLSKIHELEIQIRTACRPILVFCGKRKTAEKTAVLLRLRLYEKQIFFYHAGLTKPEKKKIENWYFSSTDGILLATTAYGMGVDKPDIRTVIHYDLSPSVEAYLQESGRAGRDREPAAAVLLLKKTDYLHHTVIAPASELDSHSSLSTRFQKLLGFALNTSKCRRESLMELLGAEPEACFGCDVCSGSAVKTDKWEKRIISFIRRNRLHYTPAGAAEKLSTLSDELQKDDAEEMIEELLLTGALSLSKNGFLKKREGSKPFSKTMINSIV